ncbi:hydroxymethylglutaryl-CoA lyase [Rhizobium sp. RAF56]|uniref:hydroxymethylglutaryl-CoA lyase n=1 Tax=Rhizobium sp. RAF56 TaxID=3233062 RepID=UPI003F9B62E1
MPNPSSAIPGERVTIVEMSPRDGLQNETAPIETRDKIALIDRLSACGFTRIEVTSFVSPKWVPQLADAEQVMAGIRREAGVRYAALTPNMKGFETALAAGADEVAVFASASESFSQRNINCTIEESIERFRPIAAASRARGILMRGYVSCVVRCPYEGAVAPEKASDVVRRLDDLGCYEISLGDTIGRGEPEEVARMLDAVLVNLPAQRLAGHFHDTSGRALDNIAVALDRGLRVFDASVAGLGGCPYAPGAKGNVDTLVVNRYLKDHGFDTGLSTERLEEAAAFARKLRSPP